ncbi:MAG: ABC transporter ATP-binding protein [Verrucomicrobiota bacterium]
MKLEVRQVSKIYQGHKQSVVALESSSLMIESGEFVCFLGPSGCGKSTLLSVIGGLENPTTGQVILGGESVLGPTPEIGMVFQKYTLFPWMTVLQNASFGKRLQCNGARGQLENDRPRNIMKRAEKLLEMVGLAEFQNAYTKELSGGMQQRTAIARALANRPKVLLMDEPFGALDSQTREEMQEMLLLLSRVEKTTVIFVTHDVEEAVFLGDRVFVFSPRPGKIIREEKIPFDKDRKPELKLSAPFLTLKRSLLHELRRSQPPSFDRNKLLEAVEADH